MPVILYTDALIFLLVFVGIGFGIYVVRQPHLRLPWRSVARSRTAMVSLVVLSAFVAIGLLDSIHFHPRSNSGANGQEVRYSSEVLSLFDLLVTPLRTQVEKTYSAPFATHLFSRESVELGDGVQVREYPRLKYGGSHLADPVKDRGPDIRRTLFQASLEAVLYWVLLVLAVLAWQTRKSGRRLADVCMSILRRQSRVPWVAILVSAGVILVLTVVAVRLGVKYHILGTDKVGQDVLYQTLKSIRTGIVIGTLTTLVMLPFAIMLGIMAGYHQKWVDDVVQYVYTTLNSIPGVLLIAAAILMLHVYMNNNADAFNNIEKRADLRLLFLVLILGITSWTGLCRLLRGETFKLREVEYVQAAVALGVGHGRIMVRHILPNVMHIVLITVVLDFSGLVLAEAVLSYVNIGVDPSTNSWGNMINSARLELAREPVVWWSLVAAFVLMFTLVLSANLFADSVRDAFDPRAQRKA